MQQITITNGIITVTMPKTKKLDIGGVFVRKEVTMANGKSIHEMIGTRISINASWEALPQSTINSLVPLLRMGEFLTVGYPDPDGTDKSADFSITIPSPGVFKYLAGNPVWSGIVLNMISQEVV